MAYLSTYALTGLAPAATAAQKITVLAAYVAEVLALHGAGWTVVTHYADEVIGKGAQTRKNRLDIMGDPARYVELGEADPFAVSTGSYGPPVHRFDLFLYYGVGTATREAAAGAVRDLLWSTSETTPGLLYAMQEQGAIVGDADDGPVSGYQFVIGVESVSAIRLVPVDTRNGDDRHECRATLTIV